ncbi:hypothetical protein ACLB2K_031354 [Fragaria x ananassa]
MLTIWRMKRDLSVSDASDLFVFQLEQVAEQNRFLHGGPWHYRNTMLVLGLYDGRGDPAAIPLNTLETWVAVEGLVHNLRNPKALNMVGSGLGRVIRFDQTALKRKDEKEREALKASPEEAMSHLSLFSKPIDRAAPKEKVARVLAPTNSHSQRSGTTGEYNDSDGWKGSGGDRYDLRGDTDGVGQGSACRTRSLVRSVVAWNARGLGKAKIVPRRSWSWQRRLNRKSGRPTRKLTPLVTKEAKIEAPSSDEGVIKNPAEMSDKADFEMVTFEGCTSTSELRKETDGSETPVVRMTESVLPQIADGSASGTLNPEKI